MKQPKYVNVKQHCRLKITFIIIKHFDLKRNNEIDLINKYL